MEEIKEVKGFPNYLISNLGYVISKEQKVKNKQGYRVRKGKILKPSYSRGYKMIGMYKDGKLYSKSLHRLLAINFIDNPNNLYSVNHKDGNKLNNDIDNLEWLSLRDNIRHAWATGLSKPYKRIKN